MPLLHNVWGLSLELASSKGSFTLLVSVVLGLELLKGKDCGPECPHVASACSLGFLTTWSLRVVRLLTWWLKAPSARVTSPFPTRLGSHRVSLLLCYIVQGSHSAPRSKQRARMLSLLEWESHIADEHLGQRNCCGYPPLTSCQPQLTHDLHLAVTCNVSLVSGTAPWPILFISP